MLAPQHLRGPALMLLLLLQLLFELARGSATAAG